MVSNLTNQLPFLSFTFFCNKLLFVLIFIIKDASKFLNLYLFIIFIYLYNGTFLERLTKSKKVKKNNNY